MIARDELRRLIAMLIDESMLPPEQVYNVIHGLSEIARVRFEMDRLMSYRRLSKVKDGRKALRRKARGKR